MKSQTSGSVALAICSSLPLVRVTLRIEGSLDVLHDLTFGARLRTNLVANDFALALELLLRDVLAAVVHAHRLDLEHRVEVLAARPHVVMRRVPVRVRVHARRELQDRLEDRRRVRSVGTNLEHHVLDEVREPCASRRIFTRADVITNVDLRELGRVIRHDDEAQTVGLQTSASLCRLERELRRGR
jgi:hypothetical protein